MAFSVAGSGLGVELKDLDDYLNWSLKVKHFLQSKRLWDLVEPDVLTRAQRRGMVAAGRIRRLLRLLRRFPRRPSTHCATQRQKVSLACSLVTFIAPLWIAARRRGKRGSTCGGCFSSTLRR